MVIILNDIPRYGTSHLMGDSIHIKQGDTFRDVEMHWHDYYELIYFYDADVSGVVNGSSISFGANSLYLLTPFDFHKTTNNREDGSVSFVNISFSSDVVDSDTLAKLSAPYFINNVCNSDAVHGFMIFIKAFYNDLKNNSTLKKHFLNIILEYVIAEGKLLSVNEPHRVKTEFLQKTFEFVSKNFRYHISLEDIAKEMHVAPSYFSARFSKNAGCTFVCFLTSFRLNYSKQLLLTTDKSVTDICFESGFSSLSHFLREFKKKYGITPKSYRLRKNL